MLAALRVKGKAVKAAGYAVFKEESNLPQEKTAKREV